MPSNDETVVRKNVVQILHRVRREGWQASFAVLEQDGRARVFLERHAAVIAQAMLIAGTQVIRDLLEEGNVG